MNKIQQLAEQAKNTIPKGMYSPDLWILEYNQKFAELILQECLLICEQGNSTQTTSAGAASLIKQHFSINDD